jgi:alpha-glucosidase (family GH31 glycosyl hydrolase)
LFTQCQYGFAVIDDSHTMLFTSDGWVAPRVPGREDGYLFAYDYDYRGALKAYNAISGRQPIVPRWALGNWWSKYREYACIKEHILSGHARPLYSRRVQGIDGPL